MGKTKRGKGTKLMAVADGNGFPVSVYAGRASVLPLARRCYDSLKRDTMMLKAIIKETTILMVEDEHLIQWTLRDALRDTLDGLFAFVEAARGYKP